MKKFELSFLIFLIIGSLSIAIAQDDKKCKTCDKAKVEQKSVKPLPDDPAVLELIENECLLNIENIRLKQNELQRAFKEFNIQLQQWGLRLQQVRDKMAEVNKEKLIDKEKKEGIVENETTN